MGNCKSYQCKQMHVDKDTRIAALEAQLAEAKRFIEMALDYEGDVFGRHHNDVVDLLLPAAPVYAKPRAMTGFLATLTDEQKKLARNYSGDEGHGDETFARSTAGGGDA